MQLYEGVETYDRGLLYEVVRGEFQREVCQYTKDRSRGVVYDVACKATQSSICVWVVGYFGSRDDLPLKFLLEGMNVRTLPSISRPFSTASHAQTFPSCAAQTST